MAANTREAMLRPEFAEVYPQLQPGVWLSAGELSRRLNGIRLEESHFEFKGSWQRGSWTVLRTRSEDSQAADYR
jgi:hypothetical protein